VRLGQELARLGWICVRGGRCGAAVSRVASAGMMSGLRATCSMPACSVPQVPLQPGLSALSPGISCQWVHLACHGVHLCRGSPAAGLHLACAAQHGMPLAVARFQCRCRCHVRLACLQDVFSATACVCIVRGMSGATCVLNSNARVAGTCRRHACCVHGACSYWQPVPCH
jgi:hypothetical protein